METLATALIIVGALLAIILLCVSCTLWQWFRNKKDGSFHMGSAAMRTVVRSDGFEVPVTYRTVQAQTPFLATGTYGLEMGSVSRISVPPSLNGSEVDGPAGSVQSSRSGIRNGARQQLLSLEDSSAGMRSTEFTRTQRKISMGVKEHLEKQGRKVSDLDLRLDSVGDDVLSGSVTSKGFADLRSLDDSDKPLSESESFSSTTVLGGKRRVGGRRPVGAEGGLSKRTYKKAGKITFSTHYVHHERCLDVHVMRAYDLVPKRSVVEVNPFVRLYLVPGKRQKLNTRFEKATKEPYFNEKVVFTALDKDELERYRLKLKVYNYTRLKKNELLGEVDIALSSIDLSAKETFNVDLFKLRSENSLAQIGVSICHQATFSKVLVLIEDVKKLPKIGMSGAPNPYVTVTLFKADKMERKDTTTKRATRDPEFKESLEFDVFTNVQLPLATFSLVVTVNHHSLVGKDEILGHVIFSVDSPQKSAADQWKAASDEPHKHHYMKHNLLDPDEI